jgi:hypothetical protein
MENQAVGNQTKHIDIRWHHMREMMTGENPRLRVLFTRSEENFADVLTKNVTEAIHMDLADRFPRQSSLPPKGRMSAREPSVAVKPGTRTLVSADLRLGIQPNVQEGAD